MGNWGTPPKPLPYFHAGAVGATNPGCALSGKEPSIVAEKRGHVKQCSSQRSAAIPRGVRGVSPRSSTTSRGWRRIVALVMRLWRKGYESFTGWSAAPNWPVNWATPSKTRKGTYALSVHHSPLVAPVTWACCLLPFFLFFVVMVAQLIRVGPIKGKCLLINCSNVAPVAYHRGLGYRLCTMRWGRLASAPLSPRPCGTKRARERLSRSGPRA